MIQILSTMGMTAEATRASVITVTFGTAVISVLQLYK
jgi:hypothetical protein